MVFSSCFEFGRVVLDLLSPLPTRSPPHKYAWQQPMSIVYLSAQEPCRFFSRKAGQLWSLNKQPQPNITSRREEKDQNKRQTNDQTKSFSAVRRRSVLGLPRSRSRPALRRRDFPWQQRPSSYPARCRRLLAMWFSDVTGCTWITHASSTDTNFTAPGCKTIIDPLRLYRWLAWVWEPRAPAACRQTRSRTVEPNIRMDFRKDAPLFFDSRTRPRPVSVEVSEFPFEKPL